VDFSHPIGTLIPSLDGEVYRVLAHTTAGLTGSRIAGLTRRGSNSGVRVVLNRLVVQGLVIEQRVGAAIVYRPNRDHLLWPALEGLVTAAEEALATLQERIADIVIDELGNDEGKTTLAFYGSVARGDSDSVSDIDIVAVFPDAIAPGLAEHLVDTLTADIERRTGNAASIYGLLDSELSELARRGDPMLSSWLTDSFTFHGPELRRRDAFRLLEASTLG